MLFWLALPFVRLVGTRETMYGLLDCGPARIAGVCGGGSASDGSEALGEGLVAMGPEGAEPVAPLPPVEGGSLAPLQL